MANFPESDFEYLDELDGEENDRESAVDLDDLPNEIYLLPLSERPFFPPQTLPILMNADSWRDTVQEITDASPDVAGLALVKESEEGTAPSYQQFQKVGTLVQVHHPVLTSGKIQFIAEGVTRFKIEKWLSKKPPYRVKVSYPREVNPRNKDQLRAYGIAIINTIKELLPLNPLYSEELKFFLNRFNANEPSSLADFAASLTTAKAQDLQKVLNAFNLRHRMEQVLVLIKKELEVAQIQEKIQQRVDDKVNESQRNYFLKEQLKAIQKELGINKDNRSADAELFRKRIENAELSEQALERFEDEIDKLTALEQGSPEYAVTRNYLDTLTKLPWGKFTEDNTQLARARKMLNKDHAGLEDVKNRILEFLAVGTMRGDVGGSIILLVGPPGVGKTSIGQTIAHALNRKFYRFSLGGMRDEAEIKGHRRTYIGAMPGKFIQALLESQSSNPVIMLDEIDKLSQSYQGDPASALLEVLDPEQNDSFLDHYLDLRVDLSKVLFVCTANQLDTIPKPLLDRMEVIRLSGYIAEEKLQIAKKYLWPKILNRVGATKSQIKISDGAMMSVIEDYAREAGVRDLERYLRQIIRKSVVKIVSGKEDKVSISKKAISDLLGKAPFMRDKPVQGIGYVTGLAWTALGGATLIIESAVVHKKSRGIKLTGSLGDVMKESAEIAYSYIRAHAADYDCPKTFFDNAYIHIHVPEGATPKDGPSAGITIATALVSLACKRKLPRMMAMTGELTLTGQVLAVGGIREKLVAARRAGIEEIMLPKANQHDFEELPSYIKDGLTVHFVEHYDDVYAMTFANVDL